MSDSIGTTAIYEIADTTVSMEPVYRVISRAAKITFSGGETSSIETTALDNADNRRSFRPGLTDPGTAQVEVNYDADLYAILSGLHGAVHSHRITASDDEDQTVTYNAFITKGPEVEFTPDALTKMKFDVKLAGGSSLGTED